MATEVIDRFGTDTNVYVIDVATKASKYAYYPNNGALQGNAYSTWLNFAPSNDDRFVNIQELFGFGYLKVAEPVSDAVVHRVRASCTAIFRRRSGERTRSR